MANKVILKLKGLNSDANSIGSVPEGSLLVAKNIVIDKEDVAEIRRGYKIFGEAMGESASNTAKQLIPYKDRILRNYEEATTDYGILEYQDTPGSTGFTEFLELKNIFGTLSVTGSTVEFTAENPHGLDIGETIVIAGVAPTGYNGTFVVEDVLSDTEFTYDVGSSLDAPSGNPLLLEARFKDAYQTSERNKIRHVEANGNLYFTTENGIKKIDTFNATVTDSGTAKALDVELDLYDNPSGFFSQEKQVGYRVLWGIKDANENLLLGAASSRAFISNAGLPLLIDDYNDLVGTLTGEAAITGTYSSVGASATLPEVKSALTGTISTLDTEAALTGDYGSISISGNTLVDIQEGYDTLISTLESETALTGSYEFATTLQDVSLSFTVPQGITQTHFYQVYRSSQSIDLDTTPNDDYQLVYEDNPTLDQLNDGIIEVVDITPDEFRGVALYQNQGQETDAQANEIPPYATDLALFSNILFYSNTKTVHRLAVNLVGLDPLVAGISTLTISNASDSFVINFGATEDVGTNTALLDSDPSRTVAQRVDTTARSIVKVINRINDNSIINAFYISGPNDAPGAMVFQSRNITDGDFSVIAADSTITIASTVISAYNPPLVTAETSDNEVKPNRIYYSKLGEPEAVPLLNYFSVGGGDNVIRRIAALRDSLFIFSDEGVFRITGDDPSSLVLAAFDNTCIIKCANSLARGNNQLFLFTDQGISSVSDTGIQIISRQIEDQILKLLSPNYTNFTATSFGTFYQSDRKYIFFTVEETTDTVATNAYVYNTLTNTWVTWDLSKTCALVNPYDDKLYFGAPDTNYLEAERKNFNRTDHADREHDVEIVSVSRRITTISTGTPTQITAAYHGLRDGDTIEIKDSNSTPSIDGEWEVTVVDNNSFTINETVTVAGSEGKWTSTDRDIPMSLELDQLTNVDVGDVIRQSREKTTGSVTYSYNIELPITAVDLETNVVTLASLADFIPGDAILFDYIPVEIKWVPIHAGDPSVLKHFRELHLMFDKFIGSDAKVECSSDIQSSNQSVDFELNTFGNWGKFNWGKQPWGGNAVTKNIRTYVPLGKQKCRLLNVTFKHEAAREQWRLEGVAAFYRAIGERTNRTS